jgi:hypothetical protein
MIEWYQAYSDFGRKYSFLSWYVNERLAQHTSLSSITISNSRLGVSCNSNAAVHNSKGLGSKKFSYREIYARVLVTTNNSAFSHARLTSPEILHKHCPQPRV